MFTTGARVVGHRNCSHWPRCQITRRWRRCWSASQATSSKPCARHTLCATRCARGRARQACPLPVHTHTQHRTARGTRRARVAAVPRAHAAAAG
eukprot:5670193-Prymnesium_polylepis.1